MSATYPDNLKTYTRQVNVDSPVTGPGYIDADDINTLQEEVEAIELELGLSPSGVAVDLATRLDEVEAAGNLYVANGNTINLKGELGDTYIKNNGSALEFYVNNEKEFDLGATRPLYIETSSPTYTLPLTTNKGYFSKVFVPRRMTIAEGRFYLKTAAAGKLAELAIYNATGTTRLAVATGISLNAAGVKTGTLPAVLEPGHYWIGLSTNSGSGKVSCTSYNLGNLRGSNVTGVNNTAYPLPASLPSIAAFNSIVTVLLAE